MNNEYTSLGWRSFGCVEHFVKKSTNNAEYTRWLNGDEIDRIRIENAALLAAENNTFIPPIELVPRVFAKDNKYSDTFRLIVADYWIEAMKDFTKMINKNMVKIGV